MATKRSRPTLFCDTTVVVAGGPALEALQASNAGETACLAVTAGLLVAAAFMMFRRGRSPTEHGDGENAQLVAVAH